MTPEQFERLPKYARDRIRTLETHNEHLEATIDSMHKGESEVFLWTGRGDNVALPPKSIVAFFLDGPGADPRSWERRLDCVVRDGKLQVMGGMSMAVYPKSGNVVEIETNR